MSAQSDIDKVGADLPRVSVVLPVRDGAEMLRRAVESILGQTLRELELIVVDDGSRDGSGELAGEMARRDSRVRVMRLEAAGLVAALNAGCDAARAPLIARMDADDWSHAERLEKQAALMDAEPDLALCGCLARTTGNAAAGIRRYVAWSNSLVGRVRIAAARFIESPFIHPTVMMRAAAFRDAGKYVDDGLPEDFDLWLRMLARGAGAKVAEVLVEWADLPGRLTRTHERYSADAFLRCRARHLAGLDAVRERGVMISGAGPTGKALARQLAVEGVRVRGFLDVHPRRTGALVGGVPVMAAADAGPARVDSPVQLVALGRPEARRRAVALLEGLGYREGRDLWCAS